MKTKYENFLQHLIHGIDEPKKTFVTHSKIGIAKDKFALKGKLLSATKIFLSDDFVNKQFVKYSAECKKDLDKRNKNPYSISEIRELHKELFSNSLPLYDNMLILFPYFLKDKEFMAGCWIQKIKPSRDFYGSPLSKIEDESLIYSISTFDNACKFHGYDERLNLSLVDYFIDFNGGIEKKNDAKVKDEFFTRSDFGQFIEPIRESYKRFIDFLPSTMHGKALDIEKLSEALYTSQTHTSQLGILVHLNLLQFINAKGSETITFKSSLPIKKRSKVQKGFEYKMLEVKKANRITTRYGDSINKNRLHQVRGHMRHYQSGKRTWIKSHQRGDEKMGIIIKDYKFK
tara:strand:- start:85 stop:1116 length:1032 start_codon:yes stop_codon:yes gene_type:complete